MSDTINTIVDKQAFEQLGRLAEDIGKAKLELIDFLRVASGSKINLNNINVPSDLNKQLGEQAKKTQQLEAATTKVNQALSQEERLLIKLAQAKQALADSEHKLGQEIQVTLSKTNANNKSVKESQTFYGKLTTALKAASNEYKDLAARKQIFNNLTDQEEKRMIRLKKTIEQYQDAVKKTNIAPQPQQGQSSPVKWQSEELKNLATANARLIESQSELGREIQLTRAQTTLNNREMRMAETLHGKVSLKLQKVAREYKELSLRKQLFNNLSEKEIQRMALLEQRFDKYHTAISEAEQKMGNYSRNVGNYKSGFDGLGWSVAQVTREFPAFAHSATTGFMAISNNLPMMVDEINKLRTANKQLAAEGKPTQSVLKSIGAAIFSFQTILSLAIVALTVYGADIVEFIFQTSAAEKAQKKLNEATAEGHGAAKTASLELRTLNDIIADTGRSYDERRKALEALKQEVTELKDVDLDHKDAMQLVIDKTAPYIKAAEARARADAFARITAEAEAELLKLQASDLQDSIGFWGWVQTAMSSFGVSSTAAHVAMTNAIKNKTEAVEDQKGVVSLFYEQYQKYLAEALLLETESGEKAATRQKMLQVDMEKTNTIMEHSIAWLEKLRGAWETYRSENVLNIEELKKVQQEIDNINNLIAIQSDSFDIEARLKLTDAEQLELSDFLDREGITKGLDSLSKTLGVTMESLILEFGQNYRWDYEEFLKFQQMKLAAMQQTNKGLSKEQQRQVHEMAQYTQEMLGAITDIFAGFTERRVQDIDKQIAHHNSMYDEILAKENLTEEQRDLIEKEKAAKEEELEKKKAELQRKQARLDKAQAIASIAINTAVAITKTLGQTGFLGLPLTPIIAAIGAAQIAAVLAQPIPQYAKGKRKTDSYEGPMIWGEKQPEVKMDKDGNIEVATKPTLGHTKKGDTIFSSMDDFNKEYDNILRASLLSNLAAENETISGADMGNVFDMFYGIDQKIENGIKEGFKDVEIKTTYISKHQGLLSELKRQRLRDI